MSSEGQALVPQMIAVDQIRPARQQVQSLVEDETRSEYYE